MTERSFKLPDIGEGTAEAELVAWHVEVGDLVAEDQPLCDVMTDKATVEVTAPFSGKVSRRIGNPGEMLPVGGDILWFDDESDANQLRSMEMAEASGVPGHIQSPPFASEAHDTAVAADQRVLASPALRKRAADAGVDLGLVLASGPGGRIRQSDLDAYLAYASAQPSKPPPPAQLSADTVTEIPVIGLRRRIAERMQDTKRRIPHFSYIEEVDVTRLEELRTELNAGRAPNQVRLTPLPFILRALARALPEFPQLNAHFDDVAGVVRRYDVLHAGIATQTVQGLVVTVLRDASRLGLWALATELSRLSDLAREGHAAPSDLSGSTLTITSLGAMGGLATTPVINSPEVAIVGLNKMIERPVVSNGAVTIAKIMNLSSSFDHRVVDGWDAASFIQRIKALLEAPLALLLDP